MMFRRGDKVKITHGPTTRDGKAMWVPEMTDNIGHVGVIRAFWPDRVDIVNVGTARDIHTETWWYPIDCIELCDVVDGHLTNNRHVSQELPQ